ncbi:MAG TPA: DUF1853 family protein [Noviherbaspirillum sp.]|uniref:DUF1853 family protein n=1 Tax=Noviherbaspirillum sp. TaxID=1926288 RepID=UPI002D2B7994|nr:DUF1853 family protein [Noviherbaspirillum sp.]HYD97336.1 DUF1853 family protein [Noviherbaspirillum sp.]
MQAPEPALTHQQQFHERWDFLHDPHVRTLAWLLDAPDLLDHAASAWQGRIASLGPADAETLGWLAALDREPQQLHAYLALQPFTRLGRYAEKLMAYYLEHNKLLYAHGVQIRNDRKETIGEFDFLLHGEQGLVHWEFATKLYLLESGGHGHHADYFVGPNLADTLGAKVRKMMDRQLTLHLHPAAQAQLARPVFAAQALVKGWLFYQGETPAPVLPQGVASAHCRGFWRALSKAAFLPGEHYAILPRLSWLAPARAAPDEVVGKKELLEALAVHFAQSPAPVLVALMALHGDCLLETDRGFIVPDDWRERAARRATG